MSEKTPQSSNQEVVTEKQHADAEFRRWCLAVGLSADEVARIVSETAIDEPCPRFGLPRTVQRKSLGSKIPRSGEHFLQFGRDRLLK